MTQGYSTLLDCCSETTLIKAISTAYQKGDTQTLISLAQKIERFGPKICQDSSITSVEQLTNDQIKYIAFCLDQYNKIIESGQEFNKSTFSSDGWQNYKDIAFV